MVSIANVAETLPPIPVPETIPTITSGSFVPQEQPEAILGIINEHNIPPEQHETLVEIANADLKPKEKPSTAPTEEKTEEKPTEEKHEEDDAAKEAREKAERELVKKQLKEVGVILLENHDVRTPLVALALSAGDTPIGDAFRKQTLHMILEGEKLKSMSNDAWKTIKDNTPKTTESDDNALKTFLKEHGVKENADIQQIVAQTDDEGKPTPLAGDLQQKLGWTTDHPIPKTIDDLANQFGDTQKNREDMKTVYTKAAERQKFKDSLQTIKEKAPTYISFGLMGISFLNQMVQEAESPKGPQQ